MSKKIITITLCIFCFILLAISGVLYIYSDREGPQITLNGNITTYNSSDDISVLLEGVQAYDNIDKDVSSSLRVYKIIPDNSGNNAKVVYIAKDNSNNMTLKETTVVYVDEGAESANLIGAEAGSTNVSAVETESLETEEETSKEESEEITEESETETEEEETLNPEAPYITLSRTRITKELGSIFSPLEYVEDILDDIDETYELYRSIIVSGDYDMSVAGTYKISYYVVDSNNNKSNVAVLTLIVK